jgi:hypothetical protein
MPSAFFRNEEFYESYMFTTRSGRQLKVKLFRAPYLRDHWLTYRIVV